MLIKKTFFIFIIISLITALVASLFLESYIKKFYPGFSSVLFFSGLIFFGGLTYAIVDRNMVIGIMAVFITLLIPLMGKWMANYWHWLVYQLGTLFP